MFMPMNYVQDFCKDMRMKLYEDNNFLLKLQMVSEPPKGYKYVATIDDHGFPLSIYSNEDDLIGCIDFPDDWFEKEEETEMDINVARESTDTFNDDMNGKLKYTCPNCNHEFEKAPRCPECGQLIKEETMRTISIEDHGTKKLVSKLTGKSYDVVDIDGGGVIAVINDENKLLAYYCGTLDEDADNYDHIYKYEESHGLVEEKATWNIFSWCQNSVNHKIESFYGTESEVKEIMKRKVIEFDVHDNCFTNNEIVIGKKDDQLYFFGWSMNGDNIHVMASK